MKGWNGYRLEKNADIEVDLDVEDIIGVIREFNEDDIEALKKELPDILSEFDEQFDVNNLPNIIAEKEYNDFIEDFKKRWMV